MRVLFDHQAFIMQKIGGISRCFAELYRHFPNDGKVHICLKETENLYALNQNIAHHYNYDHDHFICSRRFPFKGRLFRSSYRFIGYTGDYYDKSSYNQFYSIRKLQTGNFDIFHPTYYDDYFLSYLNDKPFVLTIHDMIPELFPQYFDINDFQILQKRKLAPLASAIIAVSENTKQDIVRILNVPPEKVHVVYHGCSFSQIMHANRLISSPYILFVGERGGYKNFTLFVKHIASTLKKHPEIMVVCTGRAFEKSEIQMFANQNLQDRFIHYEIKTDNEFYSLYHFAICFVYPSQYEGFGIPILEAYKSDCLVLLNRASCFPEIAGDAAVYFTISEEQSTIAEQFEYIYSMTQFERERQLQKQRIQLAKYSWENSARQLSDIYKNILNSKQNETLYYHNK